MEPMDLLRELNEASDMDQPPVDKSQVYRWIKGQLPHRQTQIRIAAALGLLDVETHEPKPELLMTHPAQAWVAQKIEGRSQEEIERMRTMIDAAFPTRTGTGNN